MLNKCCFIGNLGRDPEIRSMSNGKEVASISIGVSEKWTDKNEIKQERTEWVRVSIFNEGLVGVVKKYLKKGSKVYVEGKMQTRQYTDKDGNEKYATEIVMSGFDAKLIMLDGKKESSATDAITDEVKKQFPGATVIDDEIPFN